MINLIPSQAKKSLLLEYWVRVISAWLILWSVALVAGVLLLMPSYVLIGSLVNTYANDVAAASELVGDFENINRDLKLANQQAEIIINEASLPQLSEYVDMFERLQGGSIQLNKITLSRSDTAVGSVGLGGVARDAHALVSFRERLLEKEVVEAVDLPRSSYALGEDIVFDLTVVIVNEPDL